MALARRRLRRAHPAQRAANVRRSDVTERFAHLISQPEASVPLDEAALLVAAHAYRNLDIDRERERIDRLAGGCPAPTLDGVLDHLFRDLGFRGNRDEYYDPRNSFLNDVIDRRLGIPITLSILAIEVGRRVGAPLAAVNMPGHFLLRDRVDPSLFVDAYAGGERLDASSCEARFREVHGENMPFDPSFLEPAGAFAVVARLLANLKAIYRNRNEHQALTWVLQLRVLVPGVPEVERHELARLLARWN